MKVERPAPVPVPLPPPDVKGTMIKIVSAVCAILGLVGISYEMYLYYIPADLVKHSPSVGLLSVSVVFFVGGVFLLKRKPKAPGVGRP